MLILLLFLLQTAFLSSQQLIEIQPYQTYVECYKTNKKSYLYGAITTFAGGALNGIAEDLQFHYPEFKRTFPNVNDQFWNPQISWKNKYEDWDKGIRAEKFPFSSTALAWTTDGYHLVRTGQRLLFTTSVVLSYDKKKNWKYYLMDAALLTLIRSAGFHLTYSLIIK